jgi:hypothetical protein
MKTYNQSLKVTINQFGGLRDRQAQI